MSFLSFGHNCLNLGTRRLAIMLEETQIDTTFFAFLLSIIADALLSIFSIDYWLFYAFCLHVSDW